MRLVTVAIVFAVIGSGCAAEVARDTEAVAELSAPLIVTNCTGANISAAVAAGGNVDLNCGTAPITIQVPHTVVTLSTHLRAVSAGPITLTSPTEMFFLNTAITLQIDGINFNGNGASGIPVHAVGGTVILNHDTFQQYNGFAVSVHGSTHLTVSDCYFLHNGLSGSLPFASGIYSEADGTVVQRSTFFDNRSNGLGGAILAFGSLTVSDSTFVSNRAANGGAIGMSNNASRSFTNCTFVNNVATQGGGAINVGPSQISLRNCTFSENRGPQGTIFGAALFNNSILVDSVNAPNSCQLTGTGNLQWPSVRCAGFRTANPLLGSLASNGGPTQTMALNPGSAAIDAATGVCPVADQRGVFRPRDGDGNGVAVCDVGAYER